jgi:hypothetical protein
MIYGCKSVHTTIWSSVGPVSKWGVPTGQDSVVTRPTRARHRRAEEAAAAGAHANVTSVPIMRIIHQTRSKPAIRLTLVHPSHTLPEADFREKWIFNCHIFSLLPTIMSRPPWVMADLLICGWNKKSQNGSSQAKVNILCVAHCGKCLVLEEVFRIIVVFFSLEIGKCFRCRTKATI